MAKKSKFGSAVIFDLIVLVLAGGIFGLLALPFVKAETTIIGFTGSTTVSGYDLLNFEANAGIATVILLIIIFASVLALSALCRVFVDGGMVKSKSLDKYAMIGMNLISLALLVCSIIITIMIPANCSADGVGSIFAAGSYAVWYSLALTIVVSFAAFCVSGMVRRK